MSNNLRTRNGQPFNFIDGLDIRGVNFDRYFDGYAPKESPAFTGTPTAPTAVVDTNTTQVATTAFVLAQAANTNPQPPSSSANVGTSTMFARADHVHEVQTTIDGNATSASVLETPRKINGTEFDGSKDILIANPTFSGKLADYTVDDADVPGAPGLAARYLSQNAANKPNGDDHALLVMNYSDAWSVQIAGDWRTNTWYVRNQNDGTWGDWKSLLHSGNYGNLALPLSGGNMSGAITFSPNQTWPTFNQSTSGNAATATKINVQDTRDSNINPYDYAGVSLHLKDNDTDGAYDGGMYHAVLNLAPWGDISGGLAHQLAFTDNSNIYHRTTADGVTFSNWAKLWSSSNDGADSGLDADKLDGYQSATAATASTVAVRDESGDIHARLLRSEYDDETSIVGAIAFRTESGTDNNNYLRFCNNPAAIRTFLGTASSTHSHDVATTEVAGFMSSDDKAKLNGISAGATAYTHPAEDGSLHVPATGTTNSGKVLMAGETAGSLMWVTIDTTPPGQIGWFARNTPPTGWLEANGQAIDRSNFKNLFDAIGTTFGEGDGVNTFNIPDLRGEFVRGWDNGRGVDQNREFGKSQDSENKSHTHEIYDPGHEHNYLMGSSVYANQYGGQTDYGDSNRAIPTLKTSASTTNIDIKSSGSNESRPRNVAMLVCIKY